ncbi:sugar transferase [Lachnospiraceae bacterium 54-53]
MYRKTSKNWAKHLDFIIIDAISLQLALFLAYFIRNRGADLFLSPLYRNMSLVILMLQIVITFFLESFKNVLKRGMYKELTETLKHCCLVILLAVFYFFITQTGEQYSRLILLITGQLYIVFTYALRLFWKEHLKDLGIKGGGKRSMLLVTYRDMASSFLKKINEYNFGTFQINGLVLLDEDMTGKEIDGVPVVADKDTLLDYACRHWVDQVFINLPYDQFIDEEILTGFTQMGITVHQKLVDVKLSENQKCRVERLGGYTVLTSSINMASARQLFFKRGMDIAGGLTGCLIAAILYLFLGPIIYFCSPGPVLFSQYRIGKNGKKFKIYKFRSMYMDAEKRKKELMARNRVKDGMMFKIDHDPRIIGGEKGIGEFMRKYSLDEWPQMWNVLKGDMSLVGTRPPTLDEWDKYQLHHRARLSVKPGLTGLWQISGRSDITNFEEVVKLDKQYITEWSFKLDVKILLKTIGVVVYREGAL